MRRTLVGLVVVTALVGALQPGSATAGSASSALATRFTTIPGDPLPTMTCQIVTVDLGAGAITPLGPLRQSELCPVDYAARDDGRIYGVTLTGLTTTAPSPLVLIDPATGVQTMVGSTGVHVTDIGGLEFDVVGTLWFYGKTTENDCAADPCLYRIDPETAVATFVGRLAAETPYFVGGLTRACDGSLSTNLIETTVPPSEASPPALTRGEVGPAAVGTGTLGTLDTATAQVDAVGSLGGTTSAGGLAFSDDGTLWAVVASALAPPRTYSSATIDPTTAAVTPVATLPVSDDPQAFETMTGLTFGPLGCTAPVPVVLQPMFTG